ncbi:MAG: outer membrane protein assembly factor BamA [Epsilonproteobacteria bacterium]|nr:outer membrane protein assembly factor BamA [Campylobacterota bacterium]
MNKILPLSVVLSSILLSQPITRIEYKGLMHLSKDVASEISGIHIGDEFDINKIDESLKKFYKQGYFLDIWISATDDGGLIYNFKEKSAISKLDMNGYSSDDEQEALFIEIGLKKGDLYDKKKIESAKKKLIKKIESEGYYDTVVEVTVEPKEDSVALTFDVNKGEKIYIKNIDFEGAKKIDTDELEDALANQEEDTLGWLPGLHNGVAHIDQLEYDAFRAKDVYMKNGYLDAQVDEPLMRVDNGSYLADITYQVKEGEQYRINSVEIDGLVDGLNENDILDDLNLIKGKIFNIEKLRKDISLIKEKVADLGYAYAKVTPNFKQNKQNHTVDVQFLVQPGNKVYINDVIISGNYSTKDRVIRRDIYLAPGDLFSLTDLKDSKSTLGRRGYFEKIDIEQQRVDANRINLLVKVKETATGSIQAGGGYGSYQKFMINASLSDRNIFGSGISSSLSFDLSKVSRNYSFSINNPRVFDSEYSLGMNIYNNSYEYPTYEQDTFGAGANVGKQLTRNLYGYVGYSYSKNDIDANETSTDLVSSVFSNEDLSYTKSTITVGLSYDSTDDYFVPRKGIILGGSMSYSGVGGDEEFIAYSGRFGAYYGVEDIIDYDLIFRYKLRANMLQDEGHISGPEKLFLGGVSSVRGYQPYTIAPSEYGTNEDGETTRTIKGGKKSLVNTVEASIPLSEAARMRLAFFLDYGMIGEDSFDEIRRAGYGVSLEWYSPMGPINLVFARAKNPGELERTSSFEFTMGRKF